MSKKIRTKGKISFTRYFQKLKEGESVAVVAEPAININFPKRIQGRTGKVQEKRGRSYFVKIKDQNKEKRFLIAPIHLKKIKQINKHDKKQ